MTESAETPHGVVIRTWCCPIVWHRYVKWHGSDAYCIEPGCDHSNVEPPEKPQVSRMVAPVPRGVVTIELPRGVDDERGDIEPV